METFEVPILNVGVTELYLNQRKLEAVREMTLKEDFSGFSPLPVYDFGDGRPTLTDGHHRAFVMWQQGKPTLTVYWDTDVNITSKPSQKMYRMALDWCREAGAEDISKLQNRILQPAGYELFWLERCRRGYQLLTTRNKPAAEKARELAPELKLYGAERDMKTFYFEDGQGRLFKYYDGELKPERSDSI